MNLRALRDEWERPWIWDEADAVLLDTTLLIDHAQGRAGAAEVLERLFSEASDLLVCDVVVAEALSKGPDEEMLVIGSLIRAMEYVATHPEAARWPESRGACVVPRDRARSRTP